MIEHLACAIANHAPTVGLGPEDAAILTAAVAADLRNALGGSDVYIPLVDPMAKAQRDQAVRRAAAAGTPRDAVCRRFGISRSTYYRVICCAQ